MAAFLANVGVNAGHAARSPLFDDGTFELLPIPERCRWRRPMLRFSDLARLHIYVPGSWCRLAAHLDPDLTSPAPTYGDNCRRAGRAFSLRRARRGDLIVFLARLHATDKTAGFHLVGHLEVDDVLEDVSREPGPGWWDGNAHVRRARATSSWDSFWVFKGGRQSRLFHRAVPFRLELARTLLGMEPHPVRTEQQTIASHTRAVRRLTGAPEEMLRACACHS